MGRVLRPGNDHRVHVLVLRHLSLQLGLLCFGVGIAVTVRAHLGLSPWDVLHQGLSRHLSITIGEAAELVGLVILLLGWALGQRPGFGTVCNMVLIGFWLDRVLASNLVPDAAQAPGAVRLGMVALALVLFGIGSGAYIAPRLGAGPRDSFMLAIASRTGRPIALVRAAIEGSACAVGFVLGGSVGVGTVATALLIGPSVQLGLRLFGFDIRETGAVDVSGARSVRVDEGARERVRVGA